MVRNDAHPNILNGHTPPDGVLVCAFPRAAIVFLQGDPAAHWYIVQQGVLRTCRFRLDGQRQLTGFYFPGDAVGFETGHYLTTAEAVTEARVECYSQQSTPITSKQIERALANANRYIMLLGHRTAAERVAAFLIGLPHDGNHVAVPMSRADIADYLGLTIHTISRTFSDLFRSGLLTPKGRHRLRINAPGEIARLAGDGTDAPLMIKDAKHA